MSNSVKEGYSSYSVEGVSADGLFLRLFLCRLTFLSYKEKKLLENKLDTVAQLTVLSIVEISCLVGRVLKTSLWQPQQIGALVRRDMQLMVAYRIGVLFSDAVDYPALLHEIYDPPYALFYRGDSAILSSPSIAIVGTRRPTPNGIHHTREFAEVIAASGWAVVSGLALGTDACAHAGALSADCSGVCGKTIAVIGNGVDNLTPASNKRLAGAILENGGCIVSEYSPGTSAQKWHFPQRNRIISALSLAIVIMEAPSGSGALITADFALEHNRELCFYKSTLQCEKTLLAEKVNPLASKKKKSVRRVSGYIEEGAVVISNAGDLFSVLKHGVHIHATQQLPDFSLDIF